MVSTLIHRLCSLLAGLSSGGLWSRMIQSLILHGRLGFFSSVLVVAIFFHLFDRLVCLLALEITRLSSLHSASDMMLWLQEIPQILMSSSRLKMVNSAVIFQASFYFMVFALLTNNVSNLNWLCSSKFTLQRTYPDMLPERFWQITLQLWIWVMEQSYGCQEVSGCLLGLRRSC